MPSRSSATRSASTSRPSLRSAFLTTCATRCTAHPLAIILQHNVNCIASIVGVRWGGIIPSPSFCGRTSTLRHQTELKVCCVTLTATGDLLDGIDGDCNCTAWHPWQLYLQGPPPPPPFPFLFFSSCVHLVCLSCHSPPPPPYSVLCLPDIADQYKRRHRLRVKL